METPSQKLFKALFRVNSPAKEDRERVARNVVAYLNFICDRCFQYSEKSLQPIIARLAEGYNEQACKAAIDVCNKMWAGKTWNGKEMWTYLRPKTIFNAANFEGYIQSILGGRFDDLINNLHVPENPNTLQLLEEWKKKSVS